MEHEAAERLGLDEHKVVSTVADHGNTSAASVPLALAAATEDGRIKPGDLVLIEAIGGGLAWGSAVSSAHLGHGIGLIVGGLLAQFTHRCFVQVAQRLDDRIERTLTLSDTDTGGVSSELPAPSSRRALIWNSAADALENTTYDPDAFSSDAAVAAVAVVGEEGRVRIGGRRARPAEADWGN